MNQFDLFTEDFEGVKTGVSLDDSLELKAEFLLQTVKETKESVVFGITTGGTITSSPTIDEDIVYITSADHNVYAVEIETGKELWRFSSNGPVLTAARIHNDKLFFNSYDGNLYCITKQGKLVWKFSHGDKAVSRPEFFEDKIFFGNRTGNVYCVNADTGSLVWKYATKGPIGSRTPVCEGMVFAGSFDYNLYAIDLNGKLLWKFTTGNQVGEPTVRDGVVYVGSFDQHVYALDMKGKVLWKFKSQDAIPVGTSIAIENGNVYFGSRDFHCYAIRDGKLLWKFATKGMIFSRPYIDGENVYVGSTDSNLYVLDKKTGNLLWKYGASGPITFPKKKDDKIFFGCYDCNLYCINTKGKLLWKFHTSLDYPSEVIPETEIEHTVTFTDFSQPIEKKVGKEKNLEIGDYSDIKGAYIQNDMRDYVGNPTEQGGVPGMKYKSGSKKYR